MPTAAPAATALDLKAFGQFQAVTDGVSRLAVVFVNVYAVDTPTGFVLVDTGPPASAWYVRKAIDARYGAGARPEAIVLTHAHFDHAGNAVTLADWYDVPVYVHDLEMPYVTGRSDYAPQDPTPGGAICFLSRAFPHGPMDLGDRLATLPSDGTVPPLPGWTWVATPGHTAGHVSFHHAESGLVIAGDAVATFDLDAWGDHLTWPQELARPATPFTPDWDAARASIYLLADLKPTIVAAGHGLPIHDPEMESALRTFAEAMREPDGGRYADGKPAEYDDSGALAHVPPPVPDPVGRALAIAAAGLAAGVVGATAVLAARRFTAAEALRSKPRV